MKVKKTVKKAKKANPRPAPRTVPLNPIQLVRAAPTTRTAVTINQSTAGRDLLCEVSVTPENPWRANFIINPRKDCFTVLRQLSLCYEMYRFNSLTFEYEPTTGTMSHGTLVMFLDYDPVDDNSHASYPQFAQMAGSTVGHIASKFSISYKPNMTVLNAHKYFNASSATPDRLSDCVRIWMMTDGSTEIPLCGRVWVRYNVTLFNQEAPPRQMPATAEFKATTAASTTSTLASPLGSPTHIDLVSSLQDIDLNKVTTKLMSIEGQLVKLTSAFGVLKGAMVGAQAPTNRPLRVTEWLMWTPPIQNPLHLYPDCTGTRFGLGSTETYPVYDETIYYWQLEPDYVAFEALVGGNLYNDGTPMTYQQLAVVVPNGWEVSEFRSNRRSLTSTGFLALSCSGHLHRTTNDSSGGALGLQIEVFNNTTPIQKDLFRFQVSAAELMIYPCPYLY